MKTRHVLRTAATLAATAALSLSLAACGSNSTSTPASSSSTAAASAVTLDNCGHTITFDNVPERVLLVNRVSVVPTLNELGVLDHVKKVAGPFAPEYFDKDLAEKVAKIPVLTDKIDPSGHLQLTKEDVVGTDSDLIIGYAGSVNYDNMQGTGINIIEEPGFCKALHGDASWEHVWQHVDFYGKLFHKEDAAEKYTAELKKRLEKVQAKKPGEGLKVAVLYPATDGSKNYAYGRGSMSFAITEAAGLENVFADQADRVFEVTNEELIARNPDVIISLHSKGGEAAAEESVQGVRHITGIMETNAGKKDAIMPMMLYFAEPPSALSIDGLEMLNEFLEKH